MFSEWLLVGLQRVIDAGGDEVRAVRELWPVDPLLRPLGRWRLRAALTAELLGGLEVVSGEADGDVAPAKWRGATSAGDVALAKGRGAASAGDVALAKGAGEPSDGVLLRRVYLRLAGQPAPPEASGAQVWERYQRLVRASPARPARRWWLTGMVLLLVCAGGLRRAERPLSARVTSSALGPRQASPRPTGAFARGGPPRVGAPALRVALGERLTRWVIALDDWGEGGGLGAESRGRRLREAEGALLSPESRAAMGPRVAQAIGVMMRLAARVAEGEGAGGAGGRRATRAYLRAVERVSDSLAARGLGYYLDGDVLVSSLRRRPTVSSFRVTRVGRCRSAGRVARALLLRRLDSLNLQETALGFTRPDRHEALVSLGQVESLLVGQLLRGLAAGRLALSGEALSGEAPSDEALSGEAPSDEAPSGEAIPGDAPGSQPASWEDLAAARAAAAVRAELLSIAPADPLALGRLARLLEKRRALFGAWQRWLEPAGIRLEPPEGLSYPSSDRVLLARLLPSRERRRFDALQRRLRAAADRAQVGRLVRALARSVALHELQHRLDYAASRAWRIPEVVAARLRPRGRSRAVEPGRHPLARGSAAGHGLPETGAPEPAPERIGWVWPGLGPRRRARWRFARRTTLELSAYLAELARTPSLAHTNLSLLARYALDPQFAQRPDAWAARIILETLGRQIPEDAPPGGLARLPEEPGMGGSPGLWPRARAAVLHRVARLLETPGPVLARHAALAWARIFGEPLPPLVCVGL